MDDAFDTCVRMEQDSLLDECVKSALEQIRKIGRCAPFAVGITMKSVRERIGAADMHVEGEGASQALAANIQDKCRQLRFRAVALAGQVQIDQGGTRTSAIQVTLDHLSGKAVTCYLPFRKRWWGGPKEGAIFATDPVFEFFAFMRDGAQPTRPDNAE